MTDTNEPIVVTTLPQTVPAPKTYKRIIKKIGLGATLVAATATLTMLAASKSKDSDTSTDEPSDTDVFTTVED